MNDARSHAAVAAGGLGLVILVVGTFLPWLRSGERRRNSYQAGGALHRLLDVHGVAAAGLDAWPFVGLWCAAVVVIFAAGRGQWAAIGALVAAAAGLAVSIGALVAKGNAFVSGAKSGPIVTIIGASIVLCAVTVWLRIDRPTAGQAGARE